MIHVWHVALDQPAGVMNGLAASLSPEEQARAGRFYFHRDRRRYMVSRGALRAVLGHYLERPAHAVEFGYTDYGKPFLPGSDLQFNVTHSHELALIALCREQLVGVDVEYIHRRLPDAPALAARFFSEAENVVFNSVPPAEQLEAFYNCWTRKEAYIKAIGEGLSHPLDTFDVTLRPGEPARFLKIGEDEQEAGRWSLVAFRPGADYLAALAAALAPAGRTFEIAYWLFSPQNFLV